MNFLKWIQLCGIKEKEKSHFALGSEIPWTRNEFRMRGKDQRDVKNSRDLPQGREVILMKWHLKTTFVLGAWDEGRCRHFLGKKFRREVTKVTEGVGGTDLGGRVTGMKWVHLGLETAKAFITICNYLNVRESKVLLRVERRRIAWKLRQWKETWIWNNLCLRECSWQFYYKRCVFQGPTYHRSEHRLLLLKVILFECYKLYWTLI